MLDEGCCVCGSMDSPVQLGFNLPGTVQAHLAEKAIGAVLALILIHESLPISVIQVAARENERRTNGFHGCAHTLRSWPKAYNVIMIKVYLGLLLGALAAGFYLLVRKQGEEPIRRLVSASLPLVLAVPLANFCHGIWTAPTWNWNAIRLAPSVALLQGHPIYQPARHGPVSGHIYPPVPICLLLPAAMLPTPTSAIIAASLISFLLYAVPVAWLLGQDPEGLESTPAFGLRIYVLGLFLLITIVTPGLAGVATRVHVDGAAFGFAVLASALLYFYPQPRHGILFASALAVALSIGCKQVMAPLFVALPLWLLFAEGGQAALRYLLCLFLAGILVGGLGLVLLDPSAVWFNLVQVPGRHPQVGVFPTNLASAFLEFQEQLLLPLTFLVLAIALWWWSGELGRPGWMAKQRWSLFLLVGLGQLPLALLGRLKVGGAVNAYSSSAGFLALTLCLCLRAGWNSAAGVRDAFKVSTVVLTSVLLWISVQQTARAYLDFDPRADNEQEIATRYLKEHPGEAYFPWDPLAHLMAEGKQYHFEYGVFDRGLAGFPLSDEQFRAQIPGQPRILCVPSNRLAEISRRYLHEYHSAVQIPELPGFDCYRAGP
ncbi:MAG: hypothetical protein AB7K24_10350 [Gemmataceae bacterium]